jgi:hypothetical protein
VAARDVRPIREMIRAGEPSWAPDRSAEVDVTMPAESNGEVCGGECRGGAAGAPAGGTASARLSVWSQALDR